jgi:serine/threonine protein kinase
MSPDHVASQPRPDNDKGPAQATSDVSTSATVQWQPTVGLVEGPHGTPTESLPALAIPGYEILNEEGRGGMGVVFKARHLKLNRIVALKMILHGELASEQETRRFRTEAETIARIQHPNIIQIFEIGEHEGRLFLSLEYCGGGSLERLLRGTPLPATEAVRLLLTLAGAVAHAHLCGVIHRDLKPANVLLQDQGSQLVKHQDAEAAPSGGRGGAARSAARRIFDPGSPLIPKITDFGLAKTVNETGQSTAGTINGSPWYLSPEQASGKEVGPVPTSTPLGRPFMNA